jgi:multidrug resistance efflux pump
VLLTVVAAHRFRMEVVVPLDVAQRISTGQQVDVTVDAFPDASFQGRIVSIGVVRGQRALSVRRRPTRTARADGGSSITIMARIEIRVDDLDGRLRSGMTAAVSLELGEPKKEGEAEDR